MGHRVLTVDDHPLFRASARILLEAEGFDAVGEAETGLSAIDEVFRLHPEVVLLDVQLPDIDGFDVAARLTSHPGSPAVILVSSRDGSISVRSCPAWRPGLRPQGRAVGRAGPAAPLR